MLIRHQKEKSQFVYEFVDNKFYTSPWFQLPSMGIPINHDHWWLILMRESQRIFSGNWGTLNSFLEFLQNYYWEYTDIPTKEQVLEWWREELGEEDFGKTMSSWFFHPDDYKYSPAEKKYRPVEFTTRKCKDASGSLRNLEFANGELLGYSRDVDSQTYEEKGFVYIPELGWCTEEE